MIRRRTITSYVWNSVSGNKMVILSNCIRNFFRKFELLGNSTQGENPAPDNPQEIKSAGRKSKNLFNKNTAKQGYEFPSVANDVETPRERWFVSDFMPVKSGAKYFISGKGTGAGCKMYNKDKVFVKNVQAHFGVITIEDNITYFRINGEIKDLDKIQVEEGIVATDYEPYGYLLDVKVTGKNLFDREKARDTANWIIRDGDGYAKFPIRVGKGNKATFSYTEKLTPGKGFYLGIAQSDTGSAVGRLYHSTEINLNNNKLTVVAKGDCLYLSCNKTSIQKFFDTIQTLQVEMGSEPTPYEPYTEQTVQIALDEPLRGIGEYKDTTTKDGVVRKIKRIVFDGSEDEKWALGNDPLNVTTNRFVIRMNIINTYYKMLTMCNKMAWKNINQVDVVGQSTHGVNFYITLPKDLAPDLQTFRTWLSQNPLTVDYVLAEPVIEPLPESAQQQLQALHSENGVTHVFVDSGEVEAGINIEYKYKS